MMTHQITRCAAAVALVVGLGAGAASAQSATPAAPNRDVMADVLAELRALRSELRQASEAGIKAQLLVGRLQLQEQRIGGLSKQLADTQQQLSDSEKASAALKAQLGLIGDNVDTASSADREEAEQAFAPLKGILQQMEKRDQELRAKETYLTNLIADEQSRWTSFNSLLDQLAATLGAK
jgi:small-conductance mechanosensitive channel